MVLGSYTTAVFGEFCGVGDETGSTACKPYPKPLRLLSSLRVPSKIRAGELSKGFRCLPSTQVTQVQSLAPLSPTRSDP